MTFKKPDLKNKPESPIQKNNQQKLSTILRLLNHHYIYFVRNAPSGEPISLFKKDVPAEQSIEQLYETFEWNKMADKLNGDESVHAAHVLFRLGMHEKSFSIYYKAYVESLKKNPILSYELLDSLCWIANFCVHGQDPAFNKHLNEIREKDSEKVYFSFAGSPKIDYEIARFIRGGEMLEYYRLKIKECVDPIRKHFSSQLRSGVSDNNNFMNLLDRFAVFERFTIFNGFAYTKYSNFIDIAKDFVEGVMLSLAMNEYQPSRFDYVDTYVFHTFLLYGDPETILKFFNNYIKKKIQFKGDLTFVQSLIKNYFNPENLSVYYFKEDGFWEWQESYFRIFWRFLLLASIIEIGNENIEKIATYLPMHLSNVHRRESFHVKYLAGFIYNRGALIDAELLRKIFFCCLQNPALHSLDIFQSFSGLNKVTPKMIISDDNSFAEIKKLFSEKCGQCGIIHTDILFVISPLLNRLLKKQVPGIIRESLNNKFDNSIYYNALMGDLIGYKEYFQKYLETFKQPAQIKKNLRYLNGEISMRNLNELMNIVFKYNLSLDHDLVKKYNGISPYYDWLLEMSKFDYDFFNPMWILQYATRFYLERIFSIKKVKIKVKEFLKTNYQPDLAFYYSQYV